MQVVANLLRGPCLGARRLLPDPVWKIADGVCAVRGPACWTHKRLACFMSDQIRSDQT